MQPQRKAIATLHEWCLQHKVAPPSYLHSVFALGIGHKCEVKIMMESATGIGFSKYEAKLQAARKMLRKLRRMHDTFDKGRWNNVNQCAPVKVTQPPEPSALQKAFGEGDQMNGDNIGLLRFYCCKYHHPMPRFRLLEPEDNLFTVVCDLALLRRTAAAATESEAKQTAAMEMLRVFASEREIAKLAKQCSTLLQKQVTKQSLIDANYNPLVVTSFNFGTKPVDQNAKSKEGSNDDGKNKVKTVVHNSKSVRKSKAKADVRNIKPPESQQTRSIFNPKLQNSLKKSRLEESYAAIVNAHKIKESQTIPLVEMTIKNGCISIEHSTGKKRIPLPKRKVKEGEKECSIVVSRTAVKLPRKRKTVRRLAAGKEAAVVPIITPRAKGGKNYENIGDRIKKHAEELVLKSKINTDEEAKKTIPLPKQNIKAEGAKLDIIGNNNEVAKKGRSLLTVDNKPKKEEAAKQTSAPKVEVIKKVEKVAKSVERSRLTAKAEELKGGVAASTQNTVRLYDSHNFFAFCPLHIKRKVFAIIRAKYESKKEQAMKVLNVLNLTPKITQAPILHDPMLMIEFDSHCNAIFVNTDKEIWREIVEYFQYMLVHTDY